MENIKIAIIATKEYGKLLEKSIMKNYKGVLTTVYELGKNADKNEEFNLEACKEDIYLIEWDEYKKNLSQNLEFDEAKIGLVFLVEKLPVDNDIKNNFLIGKKVLSKYSSIKKIVGEAKIRYYANKSVKNFVEDIEKTKVVSFALFQSRKEFLDKVIFCEDNIELFKGRSLVVFLERWIEEEIVEEKNDIRRYLFYSEKNNEGISFTIEEFIKEVEEDLFVFKYSNIENPLYFMESKKLLKMLDNIRMTGKFQHIFIELGKCNYKDFPKILEYSTKVYLKNSNEKESDFSCRLEDEIIAKIKNFDIFIRID